MNRPLIRNNKFLLNHVTSIFSAKKRKHTLINSPSIIKNAYVNIKAPGSFERMRIKSMIMCPTFKMTMKPKAKSSLSRIRTSWMDGNTCKAYGYWCWRCLSVNLFEPTNQLSRHSNHPNGFHGYYWCYLPGSSGSTYKR